MGPYGKLIAGGVGLVVMLLGTIFGIGDGETLFGLEQSTVVQAVLAIGAAFGIFVPNNKPLPPKA